MVVLDEEWSLALYRAVGLEERGRRRVRKDSATVVYFGLLVPSRYLAYPASIRPRLVG
jgi:hypothetical protein